MSPHKPSSRTASQLARLRTFATKAYEQRRRFATCAAAVLALAVGYHVVFGHNGITAYRQKQANFRDLDAQLKSLTRENEALRGHDQRLQEDPDAIEHQAREELHYTRPGEVIITLPPDKPAGPVK